MAVKIVWSRFIRIILCFLLILSAIFDLATTLEHKKLLLFESNIVYSLTESVFLIIFIKVVVMGFLIFWLLRSDRYTPFFQYFFIFFVLTLILAQFYVGYVNLETKELIEDSFQKPIEQIPKKELAPYAPKTSDGFKYYMRTVSYLAYLPMFLGFVSFKLWEICFYVRR